MGFTSWRIDGDAAGSTMGSSFSFWSMSSFTIDARCHWLGTWTSLGSQYVEVTAAAVCEGYNQEAPNYCKTTIGSASPDAAAPDEQCTYAFSTNMPEDSWVTWAIDGNDVYSGLYGEIGNTLLYTHQSTQSFEIRVHVESHVATHAEKSITVGANLTCNM